MLPVAFTSSEDWYSYANDARNWDGPAKLTMAEAFKAFKSSSMDVLSVLVVWHRFFKFAPSDFGISHLLMRTLLDGTKVSNASCDGGCYLQLQLQVHGGCLTCLTPPRTSASVANRSSNKRDVFA